MDDFLKLICDILDELTVDECVQLMYKLHRQHDCVYISEVGRYGFNAYVWELPNTECQHKRLKAIRCRFLGGPPGYEKIFDGSLLSMVADRVLEYACVKKKSLKDIGLT